MDIERRINRIRTVIKKEHFFNQKEIETFLREDITELIKEIKIQKAQIELMANDLKSSGRGQDFIIKNYRKKVIKCLK